MKKIRANILHVRGKLSIAYLKIQTNEYDDYY